MPARPDRRDLAGRVYLDLQRAAGQAGRPAGEFLQLYALEGFLRRLAVSRFAGQFVLKGGMLLAALDARRPTRDVDFQTWELLWDEDAVAGAVREIAGVPVPDGLVFDHESATARPIRDEVIARGVRVSMTARLSRARMPFHVDVSSGDPVCPPPRMVSLPAVLDGSVRVLGYPVAMVLAEKIATAIERGIANTRWRDFADVYLLTRTQPADVAELRQALAVVLAHRGVEPELLAVVLDRFAGTGQARWMAWRSKYQMQALVPADFTVVVSAVIAVADPVLVTLRR